jgi:DNA polymerase-1
VRGLIHREGLSRRVIEYAAGDVRYLGEIKRGQMAKLEEEDLLDALALDNKFVRVLAYVEYCGFKLDREKWTEKSRIDAESLYFEREQLDNWLLENGGNKYREAQLDLFSSEVKTTVNWDSATQVIPVMKDFGIDTKTKDKKTGQMKDSVEANVIQGQKDKSPIVELYLKYKKTGKLVSTFGMNVLKQVHPDTERIHTSYFQILDTNRMSCGGKNKATGEEYINLQQIPSDYAHRSCFISEEGNKLIVSDYSGQEDVIFANFCKDPALLAFYQQGLGDGHSYVAKLCFPELKDVELSDIKKKHPDLRQKAKSANFAIKFGGVGATIATNLAIPLEEGEEIYNNYMKAFEGIKKYFKKVSTDTINRGYVQLNDISRRKSYIDFYEDFLRIRQQIKEDGFWDTYRQHKQANSEEFINHYKPLVREYFKFEGIMQRKSYNYRIQGSAAECTKFAALKFFNWVCENGYQNMIKICNIVHDEIIVECPEKHAEPIAKKLKMCMEDAGKPFCPIIPLKADPCIEDYWTH